MKFNSLNLMQNYTGTENNRSKKEYNLTQSDVISQNKITEVNEKQIVDAKMALAGYIMPKINLSFKGDDKKKDLKAEAEKIQDVDAEVAKLDEIEKNNFNSFSKLLLGKNNKKYALVLLKYCDSEQIEQIKLLIKKYGEVISFFDPNKVIEFINYDEKQIAKVDEIISKTKGSNEDYAISNIVNLKDDEYPQAIEVLEKGVIQFMAPQFINLTSEQKEKFDILLSYGLARSYKLDEFINLSSSQIARIPELQAKNVDELYMPDILILSNAQYIRYLELTGMNVSNYDIKYFYDLNEEEYNNAKNYMTQKSMMPIEAINFAKLSKDRQDKVSSILEKDNRDGNYIKYDKIGELNDIQFERFCILCDKGFDINSAADIVKDETKFKRTVLLLDKGVNSYDAEDIINKADDRQYQRFISLLDNGIDSFDAGKMIFLSDKQYERCLSLIQSGSSSYRAIKMAEWDDKTYNRYIELTQRGINYYDAEKIAKIPDNIYVKFNILYKKVSDVNLAIKLAYLTDKEYEEYQKLTEGKEIKSKTAIHIVPYMFSNDYEYIKNLAKKNIINDKWDERHIEDFVKKIRYYEGYSDKLKFFESQENICNIVKQQDFSDSYIDCFINMEQEELLRVNKNLTDKSIMNLIKEDKIRDISMLSLFDDNIMNNIDSIIEKIEIQREQILKNPDLYLNGENTDNEYLKIFINHFVNEGYPFFIIANSIFDTRTMNAILRSRMENSIECMVRISHFNTQERQLLSDLSSSNNVHNKPFTEKEKIEFIDLVSAYKNADLDMQIMQEMAKNGIVDTDKINKDLFNGILKNCGFTNEEISKIPDEKLTSWKIKYAHLLSTQIKENEEDKDSSLKDLIRATNLTDFNEYIHDSSNKYGQTNLNTQQKFQENNMNYNKWISPSEDNNIYFKSKDKNEEQLLQISNQIQEDMNTLMKTKVNGFIKKQFPKYVKNDKFVIPPDVEKSKTKLNEFTQNILKQMESVFKRAQGNLNDSNKKETAQNTLTIKDHLEQRLDDISKVSDTKITKNMDLTIKMWDRNPAKDIFQGNYSTCCIGMGDMNGKAMAHYLLDTAFNMIELVDNNSGETIGNALCYFAKDEKGQPSFIIDNIEINNSNKPSDEVGTKIRDAIADYASNVAKEVTGSDYTPVYMSAHFNDVPCEDLMKSEQQISFIGNIDCDRIYTDLYCGWKKQEQLSNRQELLKLK